MPQPPDDPTANNDQQGVEPKPGLVGNDGPNAGADKGANKIHWPTAKGVFFGITGVAAVAVLFYGVVHWAEERIDKAVEKKLSDETILRRIAAQSQPMLIFNERGAIIFDSGGLEYISEISIDPKDSPPFPTKILIRPKKLLSQAPLLSTIENHIWIEYTVERKTGLDWEYSIVNYSLMKMDPSVKSCRFRLEILR